MSIISEISKKIIKQIKKNRNEICYPFSKIDLDQFCNLDNITYELICNQPVEINLIRKTNYQ